MWPVDPHARALPWAKTIMLAAAAKSTIPLNLSLMQPFRAKEEFIAAVS
jgi:hypothetical protein